MRTTRRSKLRACAAQAKSRAYITQHVISGWAVGPKRVRIVSSVSLSRSRCRSKVEAHWECAVDVVVLHRRTCPDIPKPILQSRVAVRFERRSFTTTYRLRSPVTGAGQPVAVAV